MPGFRVFGQIYSIPGAPPKKHKTKQKNNNNSGTLDFGYFDIRFFSLDKTLSSKKNDTKIQSLIIMVISQNIVIFNCSLHSRDGSAPDYLCELISSYTPARRLRSSSQV